MIVQVDLSSNDAACSPSQTEGAKADVKTDKEGDDEPVKEGWRPIYKATDIREQLPSDRALKVAELRKSLSSLKDKTSGRTRAKKKSILYSLSILCK